MKALRDAWGCEDGGAAAPFAFLTCWRCSGSDAACELCHGETKGAPVTVCPYRGVPRSTWQVFGSHADRERGILPVAGAALDQSHQWVEAMRLIDGELARHREAEMKEARDGFN